MDSTGTQTQAERGPWAHWARAKPTQLSRGPLGGDVEQQLCSPQWGLGWGRRPLGQTQPQLRHLLPSSRS